MTSIFSHVRIGSIAALLLLSIANTAATADSPTARSSPAPSVSTTSISTSPRTVTQLYGDFCSSCHGSNFEGLRGPSLISQVLQHGSDDDSVANSIRAGFPDKGMPGFGAALSAGEVRALVIYLTEQRLHWSFVRTTLEQPKGVLTSLLQRFRLETVADGLETPWSIAFLTLCNGARISSRVAVSAWRRRASPQSRPTCSHHGGARGSCRALAGRAHSGAQRARRVALKPRQ